MRQSRLYRSRFFAGGGAMLGLAAVLPGKARAAQFVYKLAHPNPVSFAQHVRSVQMANAVKAETNGRLEIQIYPNASLGSASAMVSQVRLGSVQFTEIGDSSWEGVNPVAAITNVGFAFASSEKGLASMDGALGAYIRKEFQTKGLYAFERTFDYSIRHITSSTRPIRNASDLAGFRLRAQPAPRWSLIYGRPSAPRRLRSPQPSTHRPADASARRPRRFVPNGRGLSLLRSSKIPCELAFLVVGFVVGNEPGCVECAPARHSNRAVAECRQGRAERAPRHPNAGAGVGRSAQTPRHADSMRPTTTRCACVWPHFTRAGRTSSDQPFGACSRRPPES